MALAEVYLNRLARPHTHHRRYWVHPSILVGGNVVDAEDWLHLSKDFGIRSVLNVDHYSDMGKGILMLSESPVPDDGTPLPRGIIRHAVSFAKMTVGLGPIYVHCHAGISRSPAFAYAIMRWVFDMAPAAAIEAIRAGGGEQNETYGMLPKQRSYIESVELALSTLDAGS